MEGWWPIALGLVLVTVIYFRLRSEDSPSAKSFYGSTAGALQTNHTGVFEVRVVALEFDETGPVIYINGDFGNMGERLDIDFVTADVVTDGVEDTFIFFDPDGGDRSKALGSGGLVSFGEPVSLHPYEKGLFRAPLFSPDREERLSDIMARLSGAAEKMVERYDMELGEYSLEGEQLEALEHDYKHDRIVKEIYRDIGNEFIWKSRHMDITLNFLTADDELVESVRVKLLPNHEEIERVRENIDTMVINSLRSQLEMETFRYNSVVYER